MVYNIKKTEKRIAKIIYIDPETQDYIKYFEHLLEYNKRFQKEILRDIKEKIKLDSENCSVCAVGSDARLEKGPVSPIEIILFIDNYKKCSELVKSLKEYVRVREGISLFEDGIELKNINTNEMYKCKMRTGRNTGLEILSPSRIFDASYMYGSLLTYEKAKLKFVSELLFEKGKSIFRRTKNKVKTHSKVTLTGIQRYRGQEIMHYDLNEGIVFYDSENNIWSFKQGPLRTIQYALTRDFVRKIREKKNFREILDLPKNTISRLNSLKENGNLELSDMQLRDLKDSYKYFLWKYHISQLNYRNRNKNFVEFDKSEVKERCKSISDICKKHFIKYDLSKL